MDDVPYHSTKHLLAEPPAQVQERQKEAAQVQASAPILQEIITRLDERIAFYNSIDSVSVDVATNPEKFMHVIAANRLTRDNLMVEKTTLEELIRAHVK